MKPRGLNTNNLKYIHLNYNPTNLDDWWLDGEGNIGHDCNWKINQGEYPLFLSRTFKGFNPTKGIFERACINCNAAAPEALEFQAKLRRLG